MRSVDRGAGRLFDIENAAGGGCLVTVGHLERILYGSFPLDLHQLNVFQGRYIPDLLPSGYDLV